MKSIDLSQEAAPNAKPSLPEDLAKKENTISATAMIDPTQKTPNADKTKDPKKKEESLDRLKSLQESLRAEQKRKELIAGINKNRPVLAGNIVSEGYSLTGDIATDKEAFTGKIQGHVEKNFNVPSWMNSSKLKAEILVKIAPDGRLVSFSFIKSSGDSEFDLAASKAIEKSDPFPAPPESLKRVFLEEGVICGFP
jgi:colicin import membrane protein